MLSRRISIFNSSKTFLYRPWVGRASSLSPVPPSPALRSREREIWWKMQKYNHRRIAEDHKLWREVHKLSAETHKMYKKVYEDHCKNRHMYRTYPFLPLMPFIWCAVMILVSATLPSSSDVEKWRKSVESVASQEKEETEELSS